MPKEARVELEFFQCSHRTNSTRVVGDSVIDIEQKKAKLIFGWETVNLLSIAGLEEGKLHLKLGDRLTLLSDGVVEAQHASGGCASPKLHPAKKLNRRLDILTVKSRLDRPTRASWKAMKTQAGGILVRHRSSLF
jgi:hypothetical protein